MSRLSLRNKSLKELNLSSAGQALVEYIFLTMIVVAVSISLLKKIRAELGAQGEDCSSAQNKTSLVCVWSKTFGGGNFRYYRVSR